MSNSNKPKQAADVNEHKVYPSYEKDASDNTDKRKIPLLERLGLIEPVNKPTMTEQLDPVELEISATLDSKTPINTDGIEAIDKEEKPNCENLSVSEIFSKAGLEAKETNTIYLIESFIKALPANLPVEVKRQSIINLISASQIDIICLLKDGNNRLEVLKKYYQEFSNNVDDIIASNEKQIRKLNERIAYHNRIISEKQNMKEEQKSAVEFEMQKLSNIIEFIENKAKQL